MGWTRRSNPKWYNGHKRKMADYSINFDWQGNTARNGWELTWTTGSTKSVKRTTHKQHRRAAKLVISYELYLNEEYTHDEL